jgi:hypothetical protein
VTKANNFTVDSIFLGSVGVGGEGGSKEFWNGGKEEIQALATRYILRRYHQLYRSKLELVGPVEDNVPIEEREEGGKRSCSESTFCSVADVFLSNSVNINNT